MPYLPHFHLLPDGDFKVVSPVVLASVYTHLQPQGSSLGSAVLHSHLLLPPGMEVEERRVAGELERQDGSSLLCVSCCREGG